MSQSRVFSPTGHMCKDSLRSPSAQANYPTALHHYQRYTALKDSLLNETTSRQIAELDIKYQTSQKEQALKLRQKDITLLREQGKSQQAQRNALIGGTLLSAIQESQHRVQAMALIHQKLYQAEGVARISMPAYIQEVVAYLHESYELPQPIRFVLQVEPIELDITQAVPLGLIINEALTNALKYAFPDGRVGRVQVGLRELSKGGYELVIADDGIGLPADFDPVQSRSLGMTLIRGFSEQLEGQLQISGQSGLVIRLLFHDETYTANP